MQITSEDLHQIIKEELDAVLGEKKDLVPGGHGDKLKGSMEDQHKQLAKMHNVPVQDIDAQVGKGIKVEMEHTDSEDIAHEIAMEHVYEDPEYYDKLSKIEEAAKKPCKPSKGKRFAKRVDGKCRSFGQKGSAKGGGDRIRPGTKKGDAYCARSLKIKKCKNPPCANALSRKKWKCKGAKSQK